MSLKLAAILPLFAFNLIVQAQSDGSTIRFGKGDKISTLCFENVLPETGKPLCLEEYSGKIIVLYAWSILCGDYPDLFEKIELLQSAFKNSVQILMVNRESFSDTKDFFRLRPRLNKPSVPVIAGDTMLFKLFSPIGNVPSVIVNKEGIFEYQIKGYNITEGLIRKYLSGEDLTHKEPAQGMGTPSKNILFQSELIRCHAGIDVGFTNGKLINDDKQMLLAYNCVSLMEMIRNAYEEDGKYDFGQPVQIDLKHSDAASFFRPKDLQYFDDWFNNDAYTYSLRIPKELRHERFRIMQEDICRSFSLQIHREFMDAKVLVLKQEGKEISICTSGGKPEDSVFIHEISDPGEAVEPVMKNRSFEILLKRLTFFLMKYTDLPFINEADVSCNVDIRFRKETFDERLHLLLLREDLRKHGLSLKEEIRRIPVLVIRGK